MERPYHSHKQLSRRRTKWRKVNYLSCVHETSDAAFSVRVNDLICVDARNGTLLKRNREQLPAHELAQSTRLGRRYILQTDINRFYHRPRLTISQAAPFCGRVC
jgi:hypothetical protein